MIGKISLLLLASFFLASASAYTDDFALRAGGVFSLSKYNSHDDDGAEIDADESYSAGVHTVFYYKWNKFESGVESRIILGKTVNLKFKIGEALIQGEGRMRTVDISLFAKFNSKTFHIPRGIQNFFTGINLSPWLAYIKLGPSWMIQTINLDDFDVNEEFKSGHKLTYESFGASLSLGLEEDTAYKNMHPVYIELNASLYSSTRVSLVDKSDSAEVNTLNSLDATQKIKTLSFMLILGMVLF